MGGLKTEGTMEAAEVKLEVVTPLHVGVSREEELVRGLDYYVDGNSVVVVDFTTVSPKVAGDVLEALERGERGRAEGLLKGARVLWRTELKDREDRKDPDRFLPTYRPTRADDPWIPGTSFKGALRTGLLLAALEHLKKLGVDLSTLTGRLPKSFKRMCSALDNRLRVTFFQGGTARGKSRDKWPNLYPHADVLRALKVEDARPAGEVRTAVYRAELHPGDRPLDFREFVDSGTFELKLGVDRDALERVFGVWAEEGLPRLPGLVFEFLSDVRGELRDFWEETMESPEEVLERAREGWKVGLGKLYERFNLGRLNPRPKEVDVQIGWGGGRFTKTVLPLADCVLQDSRLRGLFPRTVKLVDGKVPGLVRVELEY